MHVATLLPNLINVNNLQKLDKQWRLLKNTAEIQSYPNGVLSFWQTKKTEIGDSSKMFQTLTTFVFSVMCFPHSSVNAHTKKCIAKFSKNGLKNSSNTGHKFNHCNR